MHQLCSNATSHSLKRKSPENAVSFNDDFASLLHKVFKTGNQVEHVKGYVLNVFIDIQTSKELIQMDTDKMMTYGTYTMDDEKLTQS